MKTILTLAAALTVASIATAHAGLRDFGPAMHLRQLSKLPPSLVGNWCVEFDTDSYRRNRTNKPCEPPDGYLHMRPNGFSEHELTCKLKSVTRASFFERGTYYRAAFTCREFGPDTFSLYYMITPRSHDDGLSMEATTAKFDLFDDRVCGRDCANTDR